MLPSICVNKQTSNQLINQQANNLAKNEVHLLDHETGKSREKALDLVS